MLSIYNYLTLLTRGGEVEGFMLKPHALGGGAGVNIGDWSAVFIQVGSVELLQNNSLISNKFRVVNFCIVIELRKGFDNRTFL